jgi:CHAD domain-containing protein
LEVEAKFSIPDERTFQRLLETTSLAGFGLEEPTVTDLHDRYLDTAAGAFLAGGYACRLRRQNGQTIATLKGLGGASGAVHRRVEHEVDLPGPLPPQHWPASPARQLALRLGGEDPLVSLFEIRQSRHRRRLYDGPRAVAELNLDRVRLPLGDVVASTTLELEAELLPDGDEEDLERLAVELERWGLVAESRSKFERGLALIRRGTVSPEKAQPGLDTHPPNEEQPPADGPIQITPSTVIELLSTPGIEPDDPMSEAGRKIFRFHYQRMLVNEPGTRLGEDIEALHDMRVATRRMRAAFRVFGAYYEPKEVAPYLKGLRRTGRALGPVRDLDVFRVKVQAYLSTLPELQQGSLDGFLTVLEARREASRDRLLAYLNSEKYTHFKERFGQFVETEGMGSQPVTLDSGEPRPYRLRHVAPVAVYERLAAVRAYDEWVHVSGTDTPNPSPERLHALRIACKRLRYTLEFFREVLSPSTKALIKQIVALQDHLGNLQDAVVASDILRNYLLFGTWDRDKAGESLPAAAEDAPGVEAYLAVQQAELQYLVDTFPLGWQYLRGARFSQMVAKAVAVL